MKYTISDLRQDFPDDDSVLEWLLNYRFPEGVTCVKCGIITKHYKDKGRKSYSCGVCGRHMHPTAGTILHKSSTPLTLWLYIIFIMTNTRAGVSAAQVQRELGVTYKTAWRMCHQVRKMMAAPDELLSGVVEVDETYIHANTFKRSSAKRKYGPDARKGGQIVFGIVQRGGPVKVWHVATNQTKTLLPIIMDNVLTGSTVHSDGWNAYKLLPQRGFIHHRTNHQVGQYVDGANYTQNIENVWGGLKRSIKGAHKHIGKKYVQAYANETAWRYNHRNDISMFWALAGRVSEPSPGSERTVF